MVIRKATPAETKDWLQGGLVMPGPKRSNSSEVKSDSADQPDPMQQAAEAMESWLSKQFLKDQ